MKKDLVDRATLDDDEVADSIIAAHVILGSDHTSVFLPKRQELYYEVYEAR